MSCAVESPLLSESVSWSEPGSGANAALSFVCVAVLIVVGRWDTDEAIFDWTKNHVGGVGCVE